MKTKWEDRKGAWDSSDVEDLYFENLSFVDWIMDMIYHVFHRKAV